MSATLQITTLVVTLVLALLLGAVFDTGYFQAAIIAEEKLGDRPLPPISSVLSQNHRALIYVMMTPWIVFAGTPAFIRNSQYFDGTNFLVRFSVFAAVESLLTVFLLLFLVLPFVPLYMLMDMRSNTVTEIIVIYGFWIIVAAMVLGVFRRAVIKRRQTQAKPKP